MASNEKPGHDPVNHPSHYTAHPSGVECVDIAEHMSFNVGNAIKYLWRNGLKDGQPAVQDLQKARWYIDREIQRVQRDDNDRRTQGAAQNATQD